MPADILILKKRGRKMELKITKHMRKGYTPDSHTIVVNFKDFHDLALFLQDLEDLYSAPVEKAVVEYQKNKESLWPF